MEAETKEDHQDDAKPCHADPEAAATEEEDVTRLESHSAHGQAEQTSSNNEASNNKSAVEKRGISNTGKKKETQQTLPLQVSDDSIAQNRTAATTTKLPTPRLIHSIPMQVRYIVYGIVSSALFMVMYNVAVFELSFLYVPSTIYAGTYMIFIPIQHALASCMVFGWPERYFASLSSNVPIGLTAIALGSYLTAYLDRIAFDESADEVVRRLGVVLASSAPPTTTKNDNNSNNNNQKGGENVGEFYTSLVVLIITSLWSFILAVIVNSPTEASEKKQL